MDRPLLGKSLFAIVSTLVPGVAMTRAMLDEHLAYQYRLEDEGISFAAGPLFGPEDERPSAGLIVIRADSFEAARTIAEADPLHRDGVRSFEIRRWVINEGSVSVRLSFSQRGMNLA